MFHDDLLHFDCVTGFSEIKMLCKYVPFMVIYCYLTVYLDSLK